MNRPHRNLRLLLAILVVASAAATGGLFGERVLATDSAVDAEELRTFSEILDILQKNHVDGASPDEVIYSAIQGMLRTLDPHSNFMDPKIYSRMKEQQKGSFYGLGIVVSMRGDKLTVIAPIDGTPAKRAGIRAGDVISAIEGEETARMHIDVAVQKLRGPKGTEVHIAVMRPGRLAPIPFTIVRDEIETRSISYAFMLKNRVGYVRIKSFTATTTDELKAALKKLDTQGMDTLLLDLRGNPGGLLDQAWKVSGMFLPKGKLIVYTRGRALGSAQQFYATGETPPTNVPLVVLVNGASASASEIVSGAIQDHDRGLIVGQTTWGKGLVQSVYRLHQNTGLALTTAKYYTPSGRLIQRDYSHSFDDYLFSSRKNRTILPDDQREVRYTDTGRKVLGGGGITPDVVVEPLEIPPGSFLDRIGADGFYNGDVFFTFATRDFVPAASDRTINESFQVDDEVLKAFSEHLKSRKIDHTSEEIESNRDYLAIAIKKEILSAAVAPEAGYKVSITEDPQVRKAITLFPRARQLAMLAQRETQGRGGKRSAPEGSASVTGRPDPRENR